MSDFFWLLVSAVLVFLMQAGFLCLESGRIRSKNSINVAAKNMADFILSTSLFWLFGFGIMFGDSLWGVVGQSHWFFGDQETPWGISFFLFQMMFCGTAATLTSGAVAERMTFVGYLMITVLLSAVIYPVVGHWAWSGAYPFSEGEGWLEARGFVDFAGSTIVHSVGGWVALAAILIIGPRSGRFEQGIRLPPGNNLPLSALGTLLIWFGWFGFNGGSTLEMNDQVPSILLNTCISAVWGGIAATALHYGREGYFEVGFILNGTIAGLVGITASCHAVSPMAAMVIGLVSGGIVYLGSLWMESLRIDDALDVVPAHLFAGIWGTLAVALFGQPEKLGTQLDFFEQLEVQLLGIVIIGAYCFCVSWLLMTLLNKRWPLRATLIQEEQGLNVAEHKATTELIDLLSSMQRQEDQADFSSPVPEEPFTEVGQIAHKYNQVIARVNEEIQQRDDALDRFQQSEKRKSAILDSSMDSIVSIDMDGGILEFNPAAERMFGCLKKQVTGKSFIASFVPSSERAQIEENLEAGFSLSRGLVLNRRNSFILQRASHQPFPSEITITRTTLTRSQQQEFTLHIRDVTRQAKLQERLRFLAYSDPLTSLYNRTYLMERLGSAIRHALRHETQVALLFLDLDKFKTINDTLGHKAGDELLCEVARRLTSVSGEHDVIARWGGDEFIFMMPQTKALKPVLEKADQVLSIMREPIRLHEQWLNMPTSIGVALLDKEEPDASRLIQHADIAMYWAKKNGRDNVQVFTREMANAVARKFGYEQEMHDAVHQHQFTLVYQPKVYQEQQQIVGLEALIRWHHPDQGWVSPAEFIPVAEESSLIVRIGEWVIDQALKQMAAWRETGLRLVPVAINISGRHLVSDSLVAYVDKKLKEYDISGDYLEVEMTEGVLLHDLDRCISVLAELRALNIRVSVDDFGTGYSSLSYLKRLPLDNLKIDQSFVETCDVSSEDSRICETILHLANNLGLMAIAEGVETESQARVLRGLGCEVFQGYYFYKPMEPNKIQALLSANVNA